MPTQTNFALTSTMTQFGSVYAGDTVTGGLTLIDTGRLVAAQATGAVKESYIADALSAAYVLSIGGTLTAARTLTVPDASLTVAGQNYANIFTVAQTVRVAGGLTVQQASTQDAVAIIGRAGGTGSYVATLTPGALAASVTLTLPATTTTIAGLAVAQTWTATQAFAAITATTGSFSGAITSTLATGNAPFVVASTTLVANLYGARSVLADTVTTNANLTGPITSTGNATSVAAQTGTGTTFVMNTSPTLVTPVIGVATGTSLNLSGALTAGSITNSGLGTNQNITYSGAAGLMTTAAGLVVVGTPSATAPSTGTNGPGLLPGIISQVANASAATYSGIQFGGGAALTCSFAGYACQGTAASPGATIATDGSQLALRGHDGTDYTASMATVALQCGSTWSPTNRETFIQFRVTGSGAASPTSAFRIDSNAVLCSGATNSVGTFSGGTLRPHIQTQALTSPTAGIAQVMWNNGAAAPVSIIAKSRSGTVGTQGVITTGDIAGTYSWQADDGTNFIEGARIRATTTGTIGTGQMSMQFTFDTMNASATMKTALTLTELQSVVVGNAGLATSATDGFLYIPSCAGTPTGVPTTFTNRLAIIYDRTNNKIYFYNGAWKATAALT